HPHRAPANLERALGEHREVVRLAEEIGLVRGERVDEVLPFRVRAILELREVVGEAGDSERAQALGEAAVDHLALAVAQRNAGAPVDELACALEVLPPVCELALGTGFEDFVRATHRLAL